MTVVNVNDRAEASTRRVTTPDGFMRVPGKLARSGVQVYTARDLGLDSNDEVRLYRPPEEVFEPASLASFDGVPVTLGHPPVGTKITADNWSTYAVGDVHDIQKENDTMAGELFVRHRAAIDAVNRGMTQLSNGYSFELDMTDGRTALGEQYHGVQRHIRGNHLAIVHDARGGPELKVADSAPLKEVEVLGKKYMLAQDAAVLVEALQARVDVVDVGEQKALKAEQVAAMLDTLRKEVADMKLVVPGTPAYEARVAESIQVRTEAARLVPGIVIDGRSDAEIRKEAIEALAKKDERIREALDSMTRQKLDEPHIFTAIAALYRPHTAQDAEIGRALLGTTGTAQDNSPPVGRDLMLARLTRKDI